MNVIRSAKNAERLDKNGSKSNDSIQRLQNWARNKNYEIDISFTNASLFMVISTITIL